MASGRKRGAPAGNLNALKHGFYSEQFKPKECEDLEARMTVGIEDEIAMLRVVTRRLMALANGIMDLDKTIDTLGALGLAATRLAGMIRIQHLLGGKDNETTAAISDALADVLREWKR